MLNVALADCQDESEEEDGREGEADLPEQLLHFSVACLTASNFSSKRC